MLRVEDLHVHYGGVIAVDGASLEVGAGELLALLGPNGAGKSSTLRAASGLVPHDGTVSVDGAAITGPHGARQAGVVHMPEGRGLFSRLTVEQNVALGTYALSTADRVAAVDNARARVPEVGTWWSRRLSTLSGGEQALVALARLIASRPRVALLDEPALGLAPRAVDRLFDEVAALRADGMAVVLVEQYAERAIELADRVVILERGRTAYAGSAASVGRAHDLLAGYLGRPA